jgi:hypothetical protein
MNTPEYIRYLANREDPQLYIKEQEVEVEVNGWKGGEEEPQVLFNPASLYEFNIDRARQEGGIHYLTYTVGRSSKSLAGEEIYRWRGNLMIRANR